MIKEFVAAWDKNKDKLREYIATHGEDELGGYTDLVKLVFDIVINPEIARSAEGGWYKKYLTYQTDKMLVIDDCSYQVCMLFILHKNFDDPGVSDYVYTSVYYGSCSYCDTLQSIWAHNYSGNPDEQQINDLMTLCLHILQNCHSMEWEVLGDDE